MLVQFSFNNYKCFKDEAVLNMEASGISKKGFYCHDSEGKTGLLKTAVVYGANASGKTKLFDAFNFLKTFLSPPKRDNRVPVLDYWRTKYDAFRLNTTSEKASSFFEAVIIIDGVQYRYGVELNDKEVLSEWLYMKKQREINVFAREGEDIKYNKEQMNVKVANNIISANMVSNTSSFLAVLKTFNEPLATKIVGWFDDAVVISANDIRSAVPMQFLADDEKKKVITKFMKAFDFNIEDMNLHEIRIEDVPEKVKAMIGEENLSGPLYDGISTSHRQYNELYERVGDVWFSLEKDESYGTNRLFWLSWAIISALEKGTVLFIDEYDSGIHPYIARQVVEMFYRSEKKAQLIINTQNASLLRYKTEDDQKLFVKNQVYIVDKNRYGESTLTPLTDFSSDMRSNLENLYLDGDFGGVPYVSMSGLMDLIQREEK